VDGHVWREHHLENIKNVALKVDHGEYKTTFIGELIKQSGKPMVTLCG